MRIKQQLSLFIFLVALSVLAVSTALATKPGVPWHVSINASDVEAGEVKVTVVVEGYADVQDLVATVTSINAVLLKGSETWKLSVHKGESVETNLRYRYVSTGPVPQWTVRVSGARQHVSMSQHATARLVNNEMQKPQSPRSRIRRGAEEYRSH